MKTLAHVSLALSTLGLSLFCVPGVDAATWNLAAGGSWGTAANWNPAIVPDAEGADATFNNAASGSNPAQSGNRVITIDGTRTVGSIAVNQDAANSFRTDIATGTGSGTSLTFDAAGAGPAIVTANSIAGATGNTAITARMTFNDETIFQINNVTASSVAGAVTLTGKMSGPGGVIKNGDGLMTMATGGTEGSTKDYTGITVVNGGRLRMSLLGSPTATSSFTINAGGQLSQISAGTYNFGIGPLNLNGNGPTTGPFAAFPGALRPDTNLAIVIGNPIALQSDATVHSQGAASGSITFTNNVSGTGGLRAGAVPHNQDVGQIILSGANTYSGGSIVNVGALVATGSSVNAFGSGNVDVKRATLVNSAASARLVIETGAIDAIANTAIVHLAGGGAAGVADDGYASLGAGVLERVGGLVLDGVVQPLGTYGSSSSLAMFQFDEYFAGTGMLLVVPEPASFLLMALSALALASRRRS